MPEIAEVRVVANTLKKQILNKRITKVKVLYNGIIVGNTNNFINELENKEIKDITTYGKWLLFNLGNITLLSHLRMEGKYYHVPEDEPILKHTHIIITLNNGMDLRYNDVRKFGKMKIVRPDKIYLEEPLSKLGYEPDDKRLTVDYLLEKFKNKKEPIKNALLDQTIINGLGNIYANEVLFWSKINPFRNTSSINKKEAEKIIDSAKKIIADAYLCGGTTIKSYTSSLGVIGHYQDKLTVQGRENKPCLKCGNLIKRCKISGRSTYYCEHCQK